MNAPTIYKSAREYNEASGVDLKPGHFYWVRPTFDCDAPNATWDVFPNSIQPARFIGYTDAGEERWDWLDGGAEDWPPCWYGPEVTPPEVKI